MGALAAALAVGLMAAAWSNSAHAGDSAVSTAVFTTDQARDDGRVTPVSYSTGEAGHKLTWRPYRPSRADVKRGSASAAGGAGGRERPERLAQYTSPVAPKRADSGAIDPFDDPFEDFKQGAKPVLSGTTLKDSVLEGSPPEAEAPEGLPEITIEEPSLEPKRLESEEGESVVVAPLVPENPCAAVELRPISQITHDISAPGTMFPKECPLVKRELPERQTQGWSPITFTWKASALCHKPAYFEEVKLEQYGHSCGPYLQPVVSGAHFFLTVPVLPYKMGLYPPNECLYSLGYYRMGSCAPYMLDPLPLSVRAALFEAAAWTGGVVVIP